MAKIFTVVFTFVFIFTLSITVFATDYYHYSTGERLTGYIYLETTTNSYISRTNFNWGENYTSYAAGVTYIYEFITYVDPNSEPSSTPEPTAIPTPEPTSTPTPTATPTIEPTATPTVTPTAEPTPNETTIPILTPEPTETPTPSVEPSPSASPALPEPTATPVYTLIDKPLDTYTVTEGLLLLSFIMAFVVLIYKIIVKPWL